MATDYKVRLYDTAGALVAEVTDFLALSYVKQVNAPGLAIVRLDGDHGAISLLGDKYQVEIWRRNTGFGIDWTADFYGLYRKPRRVTDGEGKRTFELTAPGQMSMLGWRTIAWYAYTANRSQFASAKAETVMKTLVKYNAASDATVANGRLREGAITGVSVQADGANGNTIDLGCAWVNLLKALQDLGGRGAVVAGGDFDLYKTGAATWEFRWYTGQLGTDRSATVIFSTDFGNMGQPEWEQDRLSEATVAIVGGQGDGTARATAIRTGADYNVNTNNIEVFVNATSETTAAGLNTKGDTELDKLRSRPSFKFDVIQTPACMYGVQYFLGDKVTARYESISATMKINKVAVNLPESGQETIGVEMVNP